MQSRILADGGGVDEEVIQMAYNNTQKRRIEEGLIKPRRDYNDGNEV